MDNNIRKLFDKIVESFENSTMVKLVFSKKRFSTEPINSVLIRKVIIKNAEILQFAYKYNTKIVYKNHNIVDSENIIYNLINDTFFNANLYTLQNEYQLINNKNNNPKLIVHKAAEQQNINTEHDIQKKRLIKADNNNYLIDLGVLNSDYSVKVSMSNKFKQINRYIEIIDTVFNNISKNATELNIIDMGSGKGYLTFALYDYIVRQGINNIKVFGIERQKELVDKCNLIAQKCKFSNLRFLETTIADSDIEKIDFLIALHACDTATDDAIYKGVKSGSSVILTAPCCYKYLRKNMKSTEFVSEITKYGIFFERLAEILTDTIRCLVLEKYGYKTKLIEFIPTEHTPKNILIIAIKQKGEINNSVEARLVAIKEKYGIKSHYLETLFEK